MQAIEEEARSAYERLHGVPPECVAFAPGRVEILGNHTDHNGGYVLSVALELGVAVAAGRFESPDPADPPLIEIRSEALDESVSFPLLRIVREPGSWANYPRGVLLELWRAGVPLGGTRMVITSNLPIGAGVSSSAALELATAEAMYALYGGRPARLMEEALLCQRAEASFVGVPCGLLDQFSSLFGKKNHALFLDCATLRHSQVPFGRDDLVVILADSGEKHALVDGKYAELRRSCEAARAAFALVLPDEVRFLRDVTIGDLAQHGETLDPLDRPRAEHVIRENERVLRGLAAVKSRFHAELGRLMLASHASSRDLLGNSTPVLDLLVEEASSLPGFLGGKLTGGGFGGSTVNIVERTKADSFAAELGERFQRRLGRKPSLLVSGIGDGARGRRLDGTP
jgi:galactokinase